MSVHQDVKERGCEESSRRLFDRGVPLFAVENAFLVAAARRVLNNAFATPLPSIRSLQYFAGVIDEMLARPLGYRDINELRAKLTAALDR